jgi:hypothetical protein
LAASYLATRYSVVLIEHGRLGQTSKFWVTTERRLNKHDLAHCIFGKPPGMLVSTFLGSRVLIQGDLVVVDDQRFLAELVARCLERGTTLADQSSLVSLSWTRRHVVAQTSHGCYRARLLIDATGTHSPIAATFRLHRVDGFLSVYGKHFQGIVLHTPHVVLAHANALGQPPPMLEVIPTGEDSAHCTVFVYSRQLVAPDSLRAVFAEQCEHNPFFQMGAQTSAVETKAGAIAIGRRRRRELPGVVAIGEAGMVQPPLLGSAFNEVLEYTELICTHISDLLASRSGVPQVPAYRYPLIKRVQDQAQLWLARHLMDGNVETFDHVVRFMASLKPGLVYNFCSNELTAGQLVCTALRVPWFLLAADHRMVRDDL